LFDPDSGLGRGITGWGRTLWGKTTVNAIAKAMNHIAASEPFLSSDRSKVEIRRYRKYMAGISGRVNPVLAVGGSLTKKEKPGGTSEKFRLIHSQQILYECCIPMSPRIQMRLDVWPLWCSVVPAGVHRQ
jgi:hypothetical protein